MIYPDVPVIPNNAYLVDGTHLHPGDSFTPPSTQVEVLFVPTSAPWLKIAEVIDYLRAVAPRTAVPIHQAVLSTPGQQLHYRLPVRLCLGPPRRVMGLVGMVWVGSFS